MRGWWDIGGAWSWLREVRQLTGRAGSRCTAAACHRFCMLLFFLIAVAGVVCTNERHFASTCFLFRLFTSCLSSLRTIVRLCRRHARRYLPECANDLSREFKMDILPAGARCAMQHMPRESRPFLGPNLYITPPGRYVLEDCTYFECCCMYLSV